MEAILKSATVTQKFARDQVISTRVSVDPIDALYELGFYLGLAYPEELCTGLRVCVNIITGTPVLELQQDVSCFGPTEWSLVRILETDPKKILEFEKFHEILRIAKMRCAAADSAKEEAR